MTENTRAALVKRMKHDIKVANITKYFSLAVLLYILYVTIEYNKNLVEDFLIQITIVTGIYLSAHTYITKIVRAGAIQGIDIISEIRGQVKTEDKQ